MKLWLALLCFSFIAGVTMQRTSLRTLRWMVFGLCLIVSIGMFVFRQI